MRSSYSESGGMACRGGSGTEFGCEKVSKFAVVYVICGFRAMPDVHGNSCDGAYATHTSDIMGADLS